MSKRQRPRQAKPKTEKTEAQQQGEVLPLFDYNRLKLERAARAEFKAWKKQLCTLVNTQSQMTIGDDGRAKYVLPARLVRLVWDVTIRERIALEAQQRGADGARERALTAMRDEVSQQAKTLCDQAEQELLAEAEAKAAQADSDEKPNAHAQHNNTLQTV